MARDAVITNAPRKTRRESGLEKKVSMFPSTCRGKCTFEAYEVLMPGREWQ